MKVLTNIIKFILLAILTICMVSIGIITIVSSTVLDQTYITQKLEETNFYAETYELVKSNFEKYIYQSGLDEVVLENICTEQKVRQDINMMISNIYAGTEQKIDTTEIANNLNNNIDKLGIKNSKNEKAIEQFVTHICDEYTDTLIHTNYESKINAEYVKIKEIANKAYNAILIVLVVDIILIIVMNIKKISKNIQDIGIAIGTTGIFELISYKIIVSKVNISGIKIFNDTFSKTIVTILEDILSKIVSLGLITLVISIILIIIYAIIVFCKKTEEKVEKVTTDK